MSVTYDASFFEVIRPGVQRSATAAVPYIMRYLADAGVKPATVVDVGCGEGWWVKELNGRSGVTAYGVDGDAGGVAIPDMFEVVDLGEMLPAALGPFDLAITLEVAEHLPQVRAEGFIRDLCVLAPVVVFSAAIPGQGGHGHFNEAWPEYWEELFSRAGYQCSGDIRYGMWENKRIEHWYRQNLMVAWSPDSGCKLKAAPVLPLVHPQLWEAYR